MFVWMCIIAYLSGGRHARLGVYNKPALAVEDTPVLGVYNKPALAVEDTPVLGVYNKPALAVKDTPIFGVYNCLP